MRVSPFLPLYLCLVSLATFAVVRAQNPTPSPKAPAKPAAPTSEQNGNVIIRSRGSGSYEDDRGLARITKDVTVVQTGQDFILYAQDLTYNRPKNQAIALGNLRVETRDSTITGDRIFADFNTKIIMITGNVVVTTHGQKDGINGNRGEGRRQLTGKPSKILCNRADWDYEARQATLTGNIRMSQAENSGTCEQILYDEVQNVAQLIGRVNFSDNKNRTFNSPDLTVYINSGQIVANKSTVFKFPAEGNNTPDVAPRPTKTPMLKVGPPPRITDDMITQFGVTPPPIPTPRPEATEAAVPAPAPDQGDEKP